MAASSSSSSCIKENKRNFYEILNATTASSFAELKANYKQLILKYHPDKLQQQGDASNDNNPIVDGGKGKEGRQGDSNAAADEESTDIRSCSQFANAADEKEFLAINEAWNCLKDPIKRKQYDMEQLMQTFQLHSNIYDRINLDEMSNDAAIWYSYLCRCGGQYLATKAVVDNWKEENKVVDCIVVRKSSDRVQNADRSDNTNDLIPKNNDLIIECNQCSLAIAVYCTSAIV